MADVRGIRIGEQTGVMQSVHPPCLFLEKIFRIYSV